MIFYITLKHLQAASDPRALRDLRDSLAKVTRELSCKSLCFKWCSSKMANLAKRDPREFQENRAKRASVRNIVPWTAVFSTKTVSDAEHLHNIILSTTHETYCTTSIVFLMCIREMLQFSNFGLKFVFWTLYLLG